MPELHFDATTYSCVLGDERTSAGSIHLRLIAEQEVQDGGATCSVWDWKYASRPEVAAFAGTVRGPSFSEPGVMFTVAGTVLDHIHELLESIDRVDSVRRFHTAAVQELGHL